MNPYSSLYTNLWEDKLSLTNSHKTPSNLKLTLSQQMRSITTAERNQPSLTHNLLYFKFYLYLLAKRNIGQTEKISWFSDAYCPMFVANIYFQPFKYKQSKSFLDCQLLPCSQIFFIHQPCKKITYMIHLRLKTVKQMLLVTCLVVSKVEDIQR